MIGSLDAQARAWGAVCKVLDEVAPGWWDTPRTGMEDAVATIKALAARGVPLERPKYGAVGTRDVDVAAAQKRWDAARSVAPTVPITENEGAALSGIKKFHTHDFGRGPELHADAVSEAFKFGKQIAAQSASAAPSLTDAPSGIPGWFISMRYKWRNMLIAGVAQYVDRGSGLIERRELRRRNRRIR